MSKLTKSSRIVLSILGIVVLAVAGGFVGANSAGGGGASAEASGSWLQKIKDSGQLRVGIASAPPMTGEQEDGTMGGPNVIPLQNLAEQMGVEFVPVTADWSNIVAGLQADRYDAAAFLDATVERSLSIQFSDPVYTLDGVWAVREDSGLRTTEDIVNAGPVAITQGASFDSAIRDLGVEIMAVDKIQNASSALTSNRVNAVFSDVTTIANGVANTPGLKVVVPDPALFVVDSGYGLPDDIDARSLQTINIAIRTSFNSGELTRAFEDAGIYSVDNLGDLQMQ